MLVLLGIAFLAGVITAVSPCVLPVLPIVLAGGASGGRRRPLRDHRRAADDVRRLDPLRGVPPRAARAARGPAAQPLDRAAVPDRGDAALPAGRTCSSSARSRRSAAAARGAHRQRLPARLRARLRVRPLRRPDPRVRRRRSRRASNFGFRPIALAIAYALGASASCCSAIASAASASRRRCAPRVVGFAPALGAVVAAAALALVFNVDTKLQTALPDWTNFLQEHTEQTALRARQALRATRSPSRRRRRRPTCPTTGRRRRSRRRPLVQLAAADDAEAARQGRADRLLDVLVHQLPAHAAAARGVGHDSTARTGS